MNKMELAHEAKSFESLVSYLQDADYEGQSVGEVANYLGTAGNNLSYDYVMDVYSYVERLTLNEAKEQCIEKEPVRNIPGVVWYQLGLHDYGRPFVCRDGVPGNGVKTIGYFRLDNAVDQMITKECEEEKHRELAQLKDLSGLINSVGCSAVIDVVRFMVNHIEPSILYVNDSLISNFGPYNNLLERNGFDVQGHMLTDLSRKPYAEWSIDEQVCIYCLYCISIAGFRCEEFSGRQLNIGTLERFLNERIQEFDKALGSFSISEGTLYERAKYCFKLKQLMKKKYFFFRLQNGFNFTKREQFLPKNKISLSVARIPQEITSYCSTHLAVSLVENDTLDGYFGRVVAEIFQESHKHDVAVEFTGLLEVICVAAATELNSEIVLGRMPRNLYGFLKTLSERRFDELCALPASEYATAVYPHPKFRDDLAGNKSQLAKICYGIAGRMMYNSWHYAPGQCPSEDVPNDRHFFFPPRMSDIGEANNLHHGGHQVANIKYSMRAPAGLIWSGEKKYGLVDLRWIRMHGKPYTTDNLIRAREYTAYARSSYQALLNQCIAQDEAVYIGQYTKEWFAEKFDHQMAFE